MGMFHPFQVTIHVYRPRHGIFTRMTITEQGHTSTFTAHGRNWFWGVLGRHRGQATRRRRWMKAMRRAVGAQSGVRADIRAWAQDRGDDSPLTRWLAIAV